MENILHFLQTYLTEIELIVFVSAIFFYIRHMVIHPHFTPHPVTFGIWLISDIANYLTYISFSKYWLGALIMPLGTAIIVVWGIVKLLHAKYKRLKTKKLILAWTDYVSVIISIVGLLIYFTTGNGKLSNIMIQVIIFMGYVSLVGNLIESKRVDEPILVWTLYCIGWSMVSITTIIGFTSWVELVFPVINGLIGCAAILVITIRNKKRANRL